MKTYAQQRLHPNWQRKRLSIMERDKFACATCKASDETLAVHHAYYVSDRMPWQYPDWSLTTLCKTCHSKWHASQGMEGELELTVWEEAVGHFMWRDDDWDADAWHFSFIGISARLRELSAIIGPKEAASKAIEFFRSEIQANKP